MGNGHVWLFRAASGRDNSTLADDTAQGVQGMRRNESHINEVGEHHHSLVDEPLARACPCSVCGGVIVLGATAIVHRDEQQWVRGRACHHLYCRARVREDFELERELTGYVN